MRWNLASEHRWQKKTQTPSRSNHMSKLPPNLSFCLPKLSAMSQPLLSFWKKWRCWKCCHLYYCEYGLQVPIDWLFFCDLPTIFVLNLVILPLTVSFLFNASPISLLLIYHFLLSRSYCLSPLAYQSISPAFCQFSFQALWPSFPSPLSTLFLFSWLPLSSVFLSLSASLLFALWVSLPRLAPPRHTTPHIHILLPHSYSTCVSLLEVVWGNQIHLQIHLFILLIPSLTQGLILFSILPSSVVCVWVNKEV